ncbi:MAG: hypothetical protein R3286_11310 [Gammaproteobacteria bacterium]|nr:hypothetical protein [Gammaproteobacteria bacterium]
MQRVHVSMAVLVSLAMAALTSLPRAALAGDVEIVHARFKQSSPGSWAVEVTLRHGDEGWDHYADAWRVVSAAGDVLGTRTLYHPHVNEQPFTRGLATVVVPHDASTVYVEAHDSVHGWSPQRLEVDLEARQGERFEVSR